MGTAVFVGSESGLTQYELARYHQRIAPDVYVPRPWTPELRDRTVAAWLWSKRRAVVAGAAASALHGARWVDATEPVELVWNNGRPPVGLVVRNDAIDDGEIRGSRAFLSRAMRERHSTWAGGSDEAMPSHGWMRSNEPLRTRTLMSWRSSSDTAAHAASTT